MEMECQRARIGRSCGRASPIDAQCHVPSTRPQGRARDVRGIRCLQVALLQQIIQCAVCRLAYRLLRPGRDRCSCQITYMQVRTKDAEMHACEGNSSAEAQHKREVESLWPSALPSCQQMQSCL